MEALKDIIKTNPGKNIVIASHGTAISTVINYFDPSFGAKEFHEVAPLMPWTVLFEFDGNGDFIKMTEHRFS